MQIKATMMYYLMSVKDFHTKKREKSMRGWEEKGIHSFIVGGHVNDVK